MYADIVVLTYQAPDINYFTYKIPQELEKQIKVGQLVEVPFGKRNPQGIFVNFKHEVDPRKRQSAKINVTPDKIKAINSIILQHPLLLPYQIELLKWMSAYYFAPMVNCLESILPKIPKSIFEDQPRNNVSARLILNKQTIVLVPTINRIPETLTKFPGAKNYVIYENELKLKEKFAAWQKIKNGEADFVFGSRQAIFAPCPNPKEIIIYDEHDGSYKDERSPYFDTLTVAEKIAELTGAKLKIVDPSPKITSYANHQKHLEIPKFNITTKIVSMQNERLAGNKTNISDDLMEELKKGKPALLFVNKKKESGHVYCRSCKESSFAQTEPDVCPNCSSPDVYFSSLNIFSLEKVIAKNIPNAKTNIIAEKFKTENIKSSQIDIATSLIFYLPYVKKYDVVAFILADTILNVADFTTAEKLYETIANLKKLVTPNGKLIIQTFNPENSQIQNAAAGNFLNFSDEELKLRKLLSYPPFGFLIKLTAKGKTESKIKTQAEATVQDLRMSIVENRLTIDGPYSPIYKRQNQSTYNIILKYKLENYSLVNRQKAIKALYPALKNLKDWQITVEPDSIQA